MDDPRRDEAEKVINKASVAAGAVGLLSPLPGADTMLVAPIQAALVLKLSSVYDRRPGGDVLKAVGYATLGGMFSGGPAKLISRMLPGIGGLARGGIALGVTQAIGHNVIESFEAGAMEE